MKTTMHRKPHAGHLAWPNLPCCNQPHNTYGLGHGFTDDPAKVTCKGDARALRRAALTAAKTTPVAAPEPPKEQHRVCARCGEDFTTRSFGGVKYCGDECRRETIREQKRAQRQKAKVVQ